MNRIAFVFTHGPHGKTTGREGLDALLATSALTNNIGVFFISDGVLLLLPNQHPEHILSRDFVATFGVLSLYHVNRLYIFAESAIERGINVDFNLILNVEWLSSSDWRQHLSSYDTVLTF